MRNFRRNEKGTTLVGATIVITLIGTMGLAALELSNEDSGSSTNEMQSFQALQVGNGGIQYALDKIRDGLDPDVVGKTFAQGDFDVVSDATSQIVSITGRVGAAKRTQSVMTSFSQQCVATDVTPASYTQRELNDVEIVKSCNNAAVITSVKFEWNFSDCAKALSCTAVANAALGTDPNTGKVTVCHMPPGNAANMHTISVSQSALSAHAGHGDTIGACAAGDIDTPIVCEGYDNQIAACGAFDLGAKVNKVRINGSLVAADANAAVGTTIDINDITLAANQSFLIDEIQFDTDLPDNAWYAVTVNFADGSSIRKPFKFGSPETETSGNSFSVKNGELTVNPNKNLQLQVLGSQITCGTGGDDIPVKVEFSVNNKYSKLFNNAAVIGGESYTHVTASGDTYKVKGAASLNSCGKFSAEYESNNVTQVKTLLNGEKAPELAGYGGQKPVQDFLAPYLDVNGNVKLESNQILMLFELGVAGNSGSAAADFQDLVTLLTVE